MGFPNAGRDMAGGGAGGASGEKGLAQHAGILQKHLWQSRFCQGSLTDNSRLS